MKQSKRESGVFADVLQETPFCHAVEVDMVIFIDQKRPKISKEHEKLGLSSV